MPASPGSGGVGRVPAEARAPAEGAASSATRCSSSSASRSAASASAASCSTLSRASRARRSATLRSSRARTSNLRAAAVRSASPLRSASSSSAAARAATDSASSSSRSASASSRARDSRSAGRRSRKTTSSAARVRTASVSLESASSSSSSAAAALVRALELAEEGEPRIRHDGVTRYASKTRLDVAERVQERAERLDVPDLGDVPVLRHLVLDVAAVLDDVGAVLGERPRDVLEQARAVPRHDRDLDAEALRRAAVPLDRREALGVAHERTSRSGSRRRWIVIPLPSEM